MILHQLRVEQAIDRDARGRFVKELCVVRGGGAEDGIPLAMVRKRSAELGGTRGSVLLIHGYGQNRYAWHLPARSLSNYLAREGFDVFNLDLRGHGRSRHLGARRPTDVSEFVKQDVPWALEEVQRLAGPHPVFLVGHSLGGLVSYAAAPLAHGAVAGVVTLGSPYHFTRGSLPLTLAGHLLLAVDRRMSFGHGALGLRAIGEVVRLTRVLVESPVFPLPIRGFRPGSMEPVVLAQHMSLAMDSGSITVLRNMFLAAAEARQSGHRLGGLSGFVEGFEAMDVPLLVVAGESDDLAPPASVEPAYRSSRSGDKTYRVFPQGHIDLIMGSRSTHTVWPLLTRWLGARVAH
ncbi:alpha/beta hydrolase [Polyangium sorediatum]|uniref:Alpha/beta hydrolase n=1 Tax=Polyangium sorediatum TaxID=889274 RepID=A0ABT6NM81_9BACT|nr:alpha/beta hydrolase [Polyangium sorediatum]MDI1429373.1 alpha/beta hydrolase [Polyangium sorediatum]